MKYLLIILAAFYLTSCASFKSVRQKRFACVRELLELKASSKDAIKFCRANYREEI